jgi:hypothetical protein
MSRDSSVCGITGCDLELRCSIPGTSRVIFFAATSKPAVKPTRFPIQTREPFPGCKTQKSVELITRIHLILRLTHSYTRLEISDVELGSHFILVVYVTA